MKSAPLKSQRTGPTQIQGDFLIQDPHPTHSDEPRTTVDQKGMTRALDERIKVLEAALNGKVKQIEDCRRDILPLVCTSRSSGSLAAYLSHPTVDLADIDKKDSRGRSALAWATEYGFAEAAQQLILCGANPRQSRPSSQGELPLLHLAIAGSSRIDPQHNSLAVIGVLLRAGADPNGVDHEGWTPLHVAASWKNHLAIRELQRLAHVEYGALTASGESAIDLSGDRNFFQECYFVNSFD
ncbi:hypothetical protein LTR47_009915 [Exophiala xenobiotica]|nr:hypothetical protein LTR47_009915 [Exophiala xenobiotica]KAK5250341.1 hypothetical protein LTS06_004919 [Exophiala xenobiotica]KAK5284237.1 hypothetical protein LTR40_000515 [Exophiala xenobiotica]KAK5345800.1 hypothetical protein LTR61_010501 [Exophiala xenobiotica]KAK5359170.1 hypothetical protein LTR11_010598 [Exophiala xenobiotica]